MAVAESSGSGGIRKDAWLPKKMRPTKVAAPVASITGMSVRALISTSISSVANRMPPSGVLKVAAMPPPAPQAISASRSHSDMRVHCPKAEPKAAPIWIIGPSRPIAPPEPMDIDEANDLNSAT